MARFTKDAFAIALKETMESKPIDKITIRDLVEKCGVNRQTFYYHFDNVYDLLEWVFEQDALKSLPEKVEYDHWREDVLAYFSFLSENRAFSMNVFHSQSRQRMLLFLRSRMNSTIRSFAEIVCADRKIDRGSFDFIVEFYTDCVIGAVSMWMELDMEIPYCITYERVLKLLDGSMEAIVEKLTK